MRTAPRAPGTATVAGLRRRLAGRLAEAGIDTPDLDTRLILADLLGCRPGEVVLRGAAAVLPDVERAAMVRADRRLAGEPVARIVGAKAFWSIDLALSKETLVPRPDTETLVEAVLAWVEAAGGGDRPLAILDLGTGSGAILLALLADLPAATGVGIDISEGAVKMARANAARLALAGRSGFAVGDWAMPVAGRFDLVVSNPPYVASDEVAGLPVEVRDHDPHIALDGGADGLAAYRAILAHLDALLADCGAAFVEIGHGQAGAVATMGRSAGYDIAIRRDLAGIERVVGFSRGRKKRGLEKTGEADIFRTP